ncbi:MAG TPA: CocE/NonD family hydrolase [Acidimicrobiales bacterium]|nr:CocE/NonD family hydrolase [Acidimicrobiales bacterium]
MPVIMADGTVLRVNVYYPTNPSTGQAAPGPFPVLLQQTPYGKDSVGNSSSPISAHIPYLVDRGYIVVLADVRGTGDSGGTWGLFDPVQARDGATLVRWSSRLPHADGRVGLFGESYMGINQFLTAGQLGPGSPLKAMFPVIAGNDLYKDTVTQGGLLDAEFSLLYLSLTAGLNEANPPVEQAAAGNPDLAAALGQLAMVEAQHSAGLSSYDLASLLDVETGGRQAYDGTYWAARNPLNTIRHVVADGVPAFLVGGWHDLFQRGEPLNFVGLQNAWDHRPVTAPMAPGQPVTSRYQLMMGPWYHLTAGQGVDLPRLELRWFDTWLLGGHTGMARMKDPLHLYELGAHRWVDARSWPLAPTTTQRLWLGPGPSGSGAASTNDGTLSPRAPSAPSGSDTVAYTGLSSACDRHTEQWSMGAISLAASQAQASNPCDTNDVSLSMGPGALTYTTAPFSSAKVLGGPIDATLYATATTTDTAWVASVEEVSPNGDSHPLTSGALLGSFRALDPSTTWQGADGAPILPQHDFTRASQHPVVPGRLTRYDIQVFPTFALVPPGWRLRLTLTTADSPHLAPTLVQLPHLVGGVYQVQRHAKAASFLNVALALASAFPTPCGSVCAG